MPLIGRLVVEQQDHVAAPELLEVAQTRWDIDREPVVTWDREGRRFWLADPAGDDHVRLATFPTGVADPPAVAVALAETMASCDFPPTDAHASVPRVAAALAVAGHRDLAATVRAPRIDSSPERR